MGDFCICGSNFMKYYTVILRKICADLMSFYFFNTSPLMTMSNISLSKVQRLCGSWPLRTSENSREPWQPPNHGTCYDPDTQGPY